MPHHLGQEADDDSPEEPPRHRRHHGDAEDDEVVGALADRVANHVWRGELVPRVDQDRRQRRQGDLLDGRGEEHDEDEEDDAVEEVGPSRLRPVVHVDRAPSDDREHGQPAQHARRDRREAHRDEIAVETGASSVRVELVHGLDAHDVLEGRDQGERQHDEPERGFSDAREIRVDEAPEEVVGDGHQERGVEGGDAERCHQLGLVTGEEERHGGADDHDPERSRDVVDDLLLDARVDDEDRQAGQAYEGGEGIERCDRLRYALEHLDRAPVRRALTEDDVGLLADDDQPDGGEEPLHHRRGDEIAELAQAKEAEGCL